MSGDAVVSQPLRIPLQRICYIIELVIKRPCTLLSCIARVSIKVQPGFD